MKQNYRYILENGVPIPCEDVCGWAQWLEDHRDECIVRQQEVGEAWVSTVFLGLDHAFLDETPLLYETMVFGGSLDQKCQRYSTVEDACRGHEAIIRHLEQKIKVKAYQRIERELAPMIRAFNHAAARRDASLAAARAVALKTERSILVINDGLYRKHAQSYMHWHRKSNRILDAIVLLQVQKERI